MISASPSNSGFCGDAGGGVNGRATMPDAVAASLACAPVICPIGINEGAATGIEGALVCLNIEGREPLGFTVSTT